MLLQWWWRWLCLDDGGPGGVRCGMCCLLHIPMIRCGWLHAFLFLFVLFDLVSFRSGSFASGSARPGAVYIALHFLL